MTAAKHLRLLTLLLTLFALTTTPLGIAYAQADSYSEEEHDEYDEHDDADHDDDHDHDHEAAEGVEGTRLLVSDASSRDLMILDLASGDLLGRFSTPGEASRVYTTPSRQYGIVIDRDENRVSIIHSGLTLVDHGDHQDLVQGNPYVLSTMNVGRQPTHFFAHGHDIALFNDQDGTVAILDERLFGLSLDYTEVVGEQPDHGGAALFDDGTVLAGYLELGTVDAFTREGERIETFEGCPRLHGEARRGNTVAFGCSDGVLLVHNDGELRTTKLDNPPASPEDARVGTLVAHDDSSVMIGNFGNGLAIIDPEAETMETVELPARPSVMHFSDDGDTLFVLTGDGALHAIAPGGGEVLTSLEGVVAFVDGQANPGMTAGREMIYVSSPGTGEIIEVHYHDGEFEQERTMSVEGAPASIGFLALEGGITH